MKAKIKGALRTKYQSLGLPETVLDGVTELLEKTITEETQIETAISGVEDYLKVFQKGTDTIRNEKSGLQSQLDELKKQLEGKDKEDEPEKGKIEYPADTPDWVKTMMSEQKKVIDAQAEQIKGLATSVSSIQTGTIAKTRQSKLDEALKGAPSEYTESIVSALGDLGGLEDADFEARLATIQTKGRELAAKNGAHVPASGGLPKGKELSDGEVDDIVKGLV